MAGSREWWAEFALSPGFGGAAAVLAAVIALVAAMVTSRRHAESADADRRQRDDLELRHRWWTRFTWASDRAVSHHEPVSQLGLAALSALVDQTWGSLEDDEIAEAVSSVIWPSDRSESAETRGSSELEETP